MHPMCPAMVSPGTGTASSVGSIECGGIRGSVPSGRQLADSRRGHARRSRGASPPLFVGAQAPSLVARCDVAHASAHSPGRHSGRNVDICSKELEAIGLA